RNGYFGSLRVAIDRATPAAFGILDPHWRGWFDPCWNASRRGHHHYDALDFSFCASHALAVARRAEFICLEDPAAEFGPAEKQLAQRASTVFARTRFPLNETPSTGPPSCREGRGPPRHTPDGPREMVWQENLLRRDVRFAPPASSPSS